MPTDKETNREERSSRRTKRTKNRRKRRRWSISQQKKHALPECRI
jgi:hypothetical protein